MKTYNHALDIAFSIPNSIDPTGENITAGEMRAAINSRLRTLSDDELVEAVGLPFDTFEEEPPPTNR